MPKFQITAPDGRVVTIQGDSAPTQDEAEEIFASLPPKAESQPQPKQQAAPVAAPVSSGGWPGVGTASMVAGAPDLSRFTKPIANAAMEGGGAGVGQALGAMTGPLSPAAIPVLGAIGGGIGNSIGQLTDDKPFSAGQLAGAMVSGAIPGGSLAKAGAKQVGKAALKYAAGNLAAKTAETAIDDKRLPTAIEASLAAAGGVVGAGVGKLLDKGANAISQKAAELAAQDAYRRETIKMGRDLGYVIPPSLVREGPVNDLMNSLGGKAATLQAAQKANQVATDNAVRDELGLARATALSPGTFQVAKMGPNKVYAEVANLSEKAANTLEQFKAATNEAQQLFAQNRKQYSVDTLNAARQRQQDAQDLWESLQKEVSAQGKPELTDKLSQARSDLAKINMVERAANKGNGRVDAQVLADEYQDGAKMTGNLEKIARFGNAFGNLLREESRVQSAGVNKLGLYAGFTMAGVGGGGAAAALGNPLLGAGIASAASVAPYFAEHTARQVMLSPAYQRAMVSPAYGPSIQDLPASIARYTAQAASRQPPPNVDIYLKR